jgi:ribulose 1,5-bisphosphate synthetase/thiazole synthase
MIQLAEANMDVDVALIGSGGGGLTAAVALAQSG